MQHITLSFYWVDMVMSVSLRLVYVYFKKKIEGSEVNY